MTPTIAYSAHYSKPAQDSLEQNPCYMQEQNYMVKD